MEINLLTFWIDYNPTTGILSWKRGKYQDKPIHTFKSNGYVAFRFNGKQYTVHRVAWLLTHGVWPKSIDHKNRKKDDNRLSNLREATQLQNMQNRSNITGIAGIQWHKRDRRWYVSYKEKHIGVYRLFCKAYKARRKVWDMEKYGTSG